MSEKLIKQIEILKQYCCDEKEPKNNSSFEEGYSHAMLVVSQKLEQTLQETTGWVDINKQKPSLKDVGKEFLVAVKMTLNYEYQVAEWCNDGDNEIELYFDIKEDWCSQNEIKKDVTHWLELIEFPNNNTCTNQHCENGIVGVIYGEEQYCSICQDNN